MYSAPYDDYTASILRPNANQNEVLFAQADCGGTGGYYNFEVTRVSNAVPIPTANSKSVRKPKDTELERIQLYPNAPLLALFPTLSCC